MDYDQRLRSCLRAILEKYSIIRGNITLSSGKKSTYYIDVKMTSLSRDGVVLASKLFVSQLSGIKAIGGPTIGADPFLGGILYECSVTGIPMKAFIVRKDSKEHGTRKLIEGPLKKGDNVAILEDVITTGSSVLQAIKTVENYGAKVVKVLALVDREEGGVVFLSDKGYPVYPVFTKSYLGL